MRSYDGESSSAEEEDKSDILPEINLQQGHWQRSSSHPTWAWEHRSSVRIYHNIDTFANVQLNYYI